MKRTFALMALLAAPHAHAQTAVSLLVSLTCVDGTKPGILVHVGANWICGTLGPGLAISPAGVISATTSASAPVLVLEPVPLSAVPSGAASFVYTTKRPLLSGGIVFWFYNSTNLPSSAANATVSTGNPITINLPANWSTADSLTLVYQSPQQ